MTFFYNYSIDCELPPEGQFGGPADWDVAERSVRGFIQVMSEEGLRKGATLFVYPDVAMKQRRLFREMAEAGIEVGLHLNGLRYSRLTGNRAKWLGAMTRQEQYEALRMGKADLEDVTGQPCLGYRACYASANNDTFPICEELGFTWTSTSAAGSHKPEVFARWAGGWPFPYHPSRCNMRVPGDLTIYEMPIARGIRTCFNNDPDRPFDLRVETPPELAGENGEVFRRIVIEQLDEMEKRDQIVRGLFPASHNTVLFADREGYPHRHLIVICRMTRELAAARGYELIPAAFDEVRLHAEKEACL